MDAWLYDVAPFDVADITELAGSRMPSNLYREVVESTYEGSV